MKKIVYLVIAAVCALSIAGLAGCGGGAASSSAAASGSSAALSDEEQIKAAFTETMDTELSPEVIGAALKNDENMGPIIEQTGMDVNEFVQIILQAMKYDAKDVKVDGDKGVLTVTMTTPDFNSDATSALMDEKMTEILADVDVQDLSSDEIGQIFTQLMSAVLSDPSMPTTSQDFDLNFNKVDGKWVMEDADKLSATVQGSI